MGERNAVVIGQKTLGKLLGVTDRTVRSAVADLVAERWISVVKLHGPGTVSAYVVNDRVAWGERRDNLHLSVFSATIVADHEEQDEALLGHGELRRIPGLYIGDLQLPSGEGLDPPNQPNLEGMDPDLPYIDRETGEITIP
jgi:DNA-binding GntR family transcriptional regulator